MKVTPIKTFSPPAGKTTGTDFTSLFVSIGFLVLGSAALYLAIRSINERNENVNKSQ